MAYVNYHDTTYSPVGLWNLNGTLNDSSGNGFNLTVEAGTERYSDIFPGVRGFNFDGSTRLVYNTTGTSLQITGSMTIEFLVVTRARASSTFVSYTTPSASTSSDNTLYSVGMDSTVNGGSLFWRSHHGTLVADSYTINNNPGPLVLNHFAVTRTSNVIQFYLNGTVLGSASSALTAATGGTNSKLRIGSAVTSFQPVQASILASVKVLASALTADQIRGEYNNTLGNFYGNL